MKGRKVGWMMDKCLVVGGWMNKSQDSWCGGWVDGCRDGWLGG